jgi:hypothetical protein
VFCRGCLEGRSHLFFNCRFSKRIWRAALSQCLISDPPTDGDNILEKGVKEWSGNGLKAVLIRLCLRASVYAIWKERNNIRHGNNYLQKRRFFKGSYGKSELGLFLIVHL